MTVPNIGPELPDPQHPESLDHVRRANPALIYRDDQPTDEMRTAAGRADGVSHRFGGVRHTFSRPTTAGGESDPDE